jgi:hypothetical protein
VTATLITGTKPWTGERTMTADEHDLAMGIARERGHVFVLVLNDMRSPNIERMESVAFAETIEELKELLRGEGVPEYLDGQWGKGFRRGGPLEWFNQPSGLSGGPFYVYVVGLLLVGGVDDLPCPSVLG